MDDDFLTERGWANLKAAAERREDVPFDQSTDRLEPTLLTDEGHASPYDDSARCEQRDGLHQSESDR